VSRITRFFRILWHRRELRWALKEFGFANLGELEGRLTGHRPRIKGATSRPGRGS
jgi:hypothetical protein